MKFLSILFLAGLISCVGDNTSTESKVQQASQKLKENISGIAEENDMCICTKEYSPVCGSNGVTYGNSCEAGCAKVEFTKGACGE